jgi:hypothetical protein
MELTTATINEILLPPFLFVVTFCFLCCQLPRARYTTATQLKEAEDGAVATQQPLDEPYSVEEILLEQESAVEESDTPSPQPDTPATEDFEDVPVEKDAAETVTSASAVDDPQRSLEAQVLAAINQLGKREARKVMGGLKLQQKRNGVELTTELMVASIRREFKASPDRVIQVMSERLPELLTDATFRKEQLASFESKGRPAA